MGTGDGLVMRLAELFGIHELWIRSSLTLGAGLLLAWLARRILITHGLTFARRTATDLDELVLKAVATPAALTVAWIALVRAVDPFLGQPEHVILLERMLPTGLLVIWGGAVAQLLSRLFLRATRFHPAGLRGARLAARFSSVFVAVAIAITVFAVWDVDVTPLVASAGLIGIALALAAQDTLANLFAGVAVYMDRLYEVGDYVVLDAGSEGEIRGEVRDVGIRSTRILTRDDILITVPNSIIANGRVVNESAHVAQYRVHVPVSVAYASDLDLVEETLVQVGRAHRLVLREPEPRARLRRFADSGVSWELLAWIEDPRDKGLVVHDLGKAIHRAFREAGIVIPFPQRDVHMVPPPEAPASEG